MCEGGLFLLAGVCRKCQKDTIQKASQGYYEVFPKVFRDYKNYVKLSCSIDMEQIATSQTRNWFELDMSLL